MSASYQVDESAGTTADGCLPLFSFAVIADVQYADRDPEGTRYFRDSLFKLRSCLADLQRRGPRQVQFVVQLGDLIDRDFPNLHTVLSELSVLNGTPLYHVLGNHDYSVQPEDIPRLLPTLGLERGYYSFQPAPGWRLIFLDGNEVSQYASPHNPALREKAQAICFELEKQGHPHGNYWNGGLSDEQLMWLDGELAAAGKEDEACLLFCHFPLTPLNEGTLLNHEAVREVLRRHNCARGYFSGHFHDGNYRLEDGIHFLNLKGMLETPNTTSYAIVQVFRDRLRIEGVGREPSRECHFQLARTGRAE